MKRSVSRTGGYAISVEDLGVQYNLRFNRKTTIRQSMANVLLRRPPQRFWALRHVNVELSHGESLGIIGPNGAGKSTLLQVLAGIMRPSEGSVDVRGQVSGLLGLGVGFDEELSGIENILLGGAYLGLDGARIEALLPSIVEFADIGQFIETPLKTYSSGMRARLGFAIATAVDPDILLLDEVLATGDANFRAKSKARVIEIVRPPRPSSSSPTTWSGSASTATGPSSSRRGWSSSRGRRTRSSICISSAPRQRQPGVRRRRAPQAWTRSSDRGNRSRVSPSAGPAAQSRQERDDDAGGGPEGQRAAPVEDHPDVTRDPARDQEQHRGLLGVDVGGDHDACRRAVELDLPGDDRSGVAAAHLGPVGDHRADGPLLHRQLLRSRRTDRPLGDRQLAGLDAAHRAQSNLHVLGLEGRAVLGDDRANRHRRRLRVDDLDDDGRDLRGCGRDGAGGRRSRGSRGGRPGAGALAGLGGCAFRHAHSLARRGHGGAGVTVRYPARAPRVRRGMETTWLKGNCPVAPCSAPRSGCSASRSSAWQSAWPGDPGRPPPAGAVATSSPGPLPTVVASGVPTIPPETIPPATPVPTPVLVPAPLTGLPVTEAAAQQHPIAVMIDDHLLARPQSGFNAAAVVWQAPAEGGIPRYMLIFQDTVPAGVGPVRSSRQYYIEWAAEWNAMYVHAGGSPQALATLASKGHGQWVYNGEYFRYGGTYLWRVKTRLAPHNVYTDGAHLRALEAKLGAHDGPIKPAWTFAPDAAPDVRPVGGTITVVYPYESIRYKYDAATNTYLRFIKQTTGGGAYKAQVDAADKVQVAPKNVVILRMFFGALSDSHPDKHRLEAHDVGTGQAWISTNGHTVKGTWSKASETAPTLLFGPDGKPITLTAGQTFVQVIPLTYTYTIADGSLPTAAPSALPTQVPAP